MTLNYQSPLRFASRALPSCTAILLTVATLALLTSRTAIAQAVPAAVPVPIVTALAGDGTAADVSTSCTTGIPVTSGVNYGDGCVSIQAGLSAPQGAAVDQYGNIYIADYTDRLVRVIYNGGAALADAITAANSGYMISATSNAPSPTPVVGDIYTIAGTGLTPTASSTTTPYTAVNTGGNFECANYTATGQAVALNGYADGCPAASAPVGPRDVTVDADGNLFITDYTYSRVRVVCVNCASATRAAKLITLENPGVTPTNGDIYTIAGYTNGYRDGDIGYGNATTPETSISLLRTPTAAVVSNSDDVFIADNTNNAVRLLYNGGTAAKNILIAEGQTPQLGYVYTIAGAHCVSAATNKTGSSTSANSCLQTSPGASGYPATADTSAIGNNTPVSVAWTVYLDANDNVFYSDSGNARIKVIYGGIAAPLTFPNTAYTTLQAGYTYSFAGQGSGVAGAQNGVAPNALVLSSPQSIGGDANGNLFFFDYGTGLFYETYAQNGIAAILGGSNPIATAAASSFCNGGTYGLAMTDAFYDGCPLTQTKFDSPRGAIVADTSGNLYFGDAVGNILRKLSYNTTFPITAVAATSAAQPYAFTFLSAQTLIAPKFLVDGGAASGFTDAGGDTCTAALSATAGSTCVVNTAFTPQFAGLQAGAIVLSSATAALGDTSFRGTATGAALNLDPGTSTTIGTGLVPNGIAIDGAGRVYIADATSKSVLRYTAGTATTVATGFNNPSGLALDAAGDLFIADSAANTVTEVPVIGTPFVLTTAVTKPEGLATDTMGNLYVADSGNNRVLIFAPGSSATSTPTIAGFTGLNAPHAVAVNAYGDLYTADSTHITGMNSFGVQTTVASSGSYTGLAIDAAGNVLATIGQTLIEYPANNKTAITLSSSLITPQSLTIDPAGNAYIADTGKTGYLQIQRTAGYFSFASAPQTTTLELTSSGNITLTAPTYTQSNTADFSITAASGNGCSGVLTSGATCALAATFNPQNAGTVTDSVSFNTNATNAPSTFTLTGTTVPLVPTLTLSVAPPTLAYGSTETLSANISGVKSTAGTVAFLNGTTTIATIATDANGNAIYAYQPTVGSDTITATFTPTVPTGSTVTSSPASFSVTQATPTVGLTSSANSGYAGTTSFQFTATVLPVTTGAPSGSVTFYSGTTNLGSVALNGDTANLTTTTLPVGSDCITAAYSGDGNFVTATSSCVTVTVAAGFSVTPSSTTLAFQNNYQEAQAYLTIGPGGRTDTLTFACQGLPAKLNCFFSPATLTLTGGTTASTVQLLVSNSSATASLNPNNAPMHGCPQRTITLAGLSFAAILLFGLRRRRLPMLLTLLLLTLGMSIGLTGCGSGPTALEQKGGSYNFTVTVDSGSTTLQTLPFTLTIP